MYSSFKTVNISYADAVVGCKGVTALESDSETISNGKSSILFLKSFANRAILSISLDAPPCFFISLNLALICLRIPTAGVKGVWPLSPFFNAFFKSKYMHFTSFLLTRSIASWDKTITEIPGGQANAFWDPVIITSTPNFFISNSSAKNELIASTIKKRLLFLQNSLIKFIS